MLIGIFFSRLPDGSLMEITKVYPMDAVYDSPEDVPEDVSFFLHMVLEEDKYVIIFLEYPNFWFLSGENKQTVRRVFKLDSSGEKLLC